VTGGKNYSLEISALGTFKKLTHGFRKRRVACSDNPVAGFKKLTHVSIRGSVACVDNPVAGLKKLTYYYHMRKCRMR
jgi:hypothetical protein